MNVSQFIFAGPVTAIFDLWIIGDKFVTDLFHDLQLMHSRAREAKQPDLHIYDHYNVKCFTANPLSDVKSVVVCILNAILKALNDFTRMPKVVVIIPEWDMIKFLNYYKPCASHLFEIVLHWLANNIQRAIQSKHDMLLNRKLGAVMHGTPTILWVKIFDRICSHDRSLSVCNKFNNVLQDVIADKKNHHIIDLEDVVYDASYFRSRDDLNSDGNIKFWHDLDTAIKAFEIRQNSAGMAMVGLGTHKPRASSFH